MATATKRLLPNYDVFDERRYFHPGVGPETIVNVRGVAVGLLVCEDVWTARRSGGRSRARGRHAARRRQRVAVRARVVARSERPCCASARSRRTARSPTSTWWAARTSSSSTARAWSSTPRGEVVARASAFREELLVCELEARDSSVGVVARHALRARRVARAVARTSTTSQEPLGEVEEIYEALVMGTRDYLRKNGFREAIVALSGGVDSSLVAAIAVDAVGARAVRGFAMPSRYSSEGSVVDACELAARLDIEVDHAADRGGARDLRPIARPRCSTGRPAGVTDENLQSRIRGGADDGDLQRDGRDRAHDRQQVRDGGRLLDALRRLGRRLRRHQGRAQDPRLRALPLPQRAWPAATATPSRSPRRCSTRRPRPNCAPTSATTSRCRPTRCSTRCSSSTSKRTPPPRRSSRSATTAALVRRITRLVDRSEYKRRQMPPGRAHLEEGLRPRPAHAHHQRLSSRGRVIARARRCEHLLVVLRRPLPRAWARARRASPTTPTSCAPTRAVATFGEVALALREYLGDAPVDAAGRRRGGTCFDGRRRRPVGRDGALLPGHRRRAAAARLAARRARGRRPRRRGARGARAWPADAVVARDAGASRDVAATPGAIEDRHWQQRARGLGRRLDEQGYAESFGISR